MIKNGLKTSEFYLAAAAVLVGAFLASGLIPGGIFSAVAGAVLMVIAAFGYTYHRGQLKMVDATLSIEKDGWRSTEFFLSLSVVICNSLLGAGVFMPETSAGKIVGAVAAALAALGYARSRTQLKEEAVLQEQD